MHIEHARLHDFEQHSCTKVCFIYLSQAYHDAKIAALELDLLLLFLFASMTDLNEDIAAMSKFAMLRDSARLQYL